ncbi:MAG: DUF4091 domain-containing protein [Ruminococcaceae bacterium]|nr:DUF4091 domain-containing protein [Oscillospiraceae bacterium]
MNITVFPVSSLEKVFRDEQPKAYLKNISLLTDERGSVQFAFCADEDGEVNVRVTSGVPVKTYFVQEVYAGKAAYDDKDDFILRNGESGMYPDVLAPLGARIAVKKGEWYSIWVELCPTDGSCGKNKLTANIIAGDTCATAEIPVTVHEQKIIDQTLICTHWFHSDCLHSYYKVPVFSEEYWRITENFVKTAVEHGINFLLTPLFTPPLDTAVGGERPTVQLVDVTKKRSGYEFGFEKLDRWIDMALRCGVQYFEMSHLFTQWGATCAPKIMAKTASGYRQIFGWHTNAAGKAYGDFLEQFAAALIPYLKEKGIADRCRFHTSDEPGDDHYYSYRRAAKKMQSLFGEFDSIDALSELRFYKNGLVRTPVPEEGSFHKFKNRVGERWTYFCCGQYRKHLPNRFFCMPSARCRVLGTLFYLNEIQGFLQWGYNFWYTQYSAREVDPYTESDAGGAFPSGDSYQVYPGADGTAVPSLRLKVFRDALQDLRLMQQLEALTDRKTVEKIIYKGSKNKNFTFFDYPTDGAWYEDLHTRLTDAIAYYSKENA